ncbi:hypothetical protein FRC03_004495 [Tulasnella sp. 419]|nr:hypothetical protein FRC03_004495 [Tulasnella sp. 419]
MISPATSKTGFLRPVLDQLPRACDLTLQWPANIPATPTIYSLFHRISQFLSHASSPVHSITISGGTATISPTSPTQPSIHTSIGAQIFLFDLPTSESLR